MIFMNLTKFQMINPFKTMLINKMMESLRNGSALMLLVLHRQHENQKAYLHHKNLQNKRENYTT